MAREKAIKEFDIQVSEIIEKSLQNLYKDYVSMCNRTGLGHQPYNKELEKNDK